MTRQRHVELESLDLGGTAPGSALGIGVILNLNNMLQEIMAYTALAKRELGAEHPVNGHLAAIEATSVRAGCLVRKLIDADD